MSAPNLSKDAPQRKPIGYTTDRLEAIRSGQPWPPPVAPVVTNRDMYRLLYSHAAHAGRVVAAVALALNQAVEAHLDRPYHGSAAAGSGVAIRSS